MIDRIEHKMAPYIKVTKNGPYLLFGAKKISEKIILTDENGISVKYGDGRACQYQISCIRMKFN